jgi:HlyD family secretion protein
MNKKRLMAPVIVIVLLVAATLYFEVFRKMDSDSSRIEGSGTIEVTEIDISSKISGRLAVLPRAEGESVKKGDLVVKLEYDELSAQKLSALANYVNAEKNYQRISELYKSGSVSKKDRDNAETSFRVAKAAYNQVKATIEHAVIYSPVSGTVLDTNLEVGEMVFPGTPILTIADITKPWIYIYVNERKLGHVKIGQKVNITVDSFPDKVFHGRVISISNKAEFTPKTIQTREERVKLVFAVKVSVENPDQGLKPGMPADAQILVSGEQK